MTINVPEFSFTCLTDKGPVRKKNEDAVQVIEDLGLFVLADGVGGHRAGEIASATAVDVIEDYIRTSLSSLREMENVDGRSEFIQLALIEALRAANRRILQLSEEDEAYRGLGTTVVCGLLLDNHLVATHAGDSRLYRFSDGRLQQLTSDHSLYQEHIDAFGSPDETIPRNIVTRVLGKSDRCVPNVLVEELQSGSVYFCSTDGVHDWLSEAELIGVLNSQKSLATQARELVDRAFSNGSQDNASLIMLKPGKTSALSGRIRAWLQG